MNKIVLIPLTIILISMCGCAGFDTPTPEEIISKPLGTESVKIGMTKDRVKDLWGEPDEINYVEDKQKWGGSREEWVYKGFTSAIPVDAGYLSKTKRLYFDGNNLTNMEGD